MASDPSIGLPRVAGAPRLIEWTGERCVPWAPDIQVVYEHFHRYLWAARIVAGRRVLDMASGEGFGSAILARSAESVVGVEIDPQTVRHSRLNYQLPNLRFDEGDARDLSAYPDGSFGAVVAFEMIEHVSEHQQVLAEIKRVLTCDGLLIMSTPDREAYDQASGENPFHERELDQSEFTALLRGSFAHVGTWGQRTISGSSLSAIDPEQAEDEPARTYFIERSGEEWRVAPGVSALYVVAVASDADLPAVPAASTLADPAIALVRAAEAAGGAAVARMQQAVQEAERDRDTARAHTAELEEMRVAAERELTSLRARVNHDAHTISTLDAALNAANRRYARIEGSVTWQFFQRARGKLFGLLGGEDSRAVAILQATLRWVGRSASGKRLPTRAGRGLVTRAPSRGGPIELPVFEQPEVSIVIPLYAHAELTRAALETIAEHTQDLAYEVILVDDDADAETKAMLAHVRGAVTLVNEVNQGYLRSVKRGAAAARGRWLVLCNNDIEVQPGWLSAMLDCGESSPDIAIVAPKFLYPDGTLAEAGGIIWSDGTGANYGRGDDPSRCHYEYRRPIDYGSAAALLVRGDFWHEAGGFDGRFEPMYYEDTDLCFEARARGLRVMYEPQARVVHVEGATAGVDISTGHKRYQEVNRAKFVEKWRERLEAEHLPTDFSRLWAAANLRRQPHVLVVDHRMPMWDRESGAVRMRGILQTLIDAGCHVVFLPDNFNPEQPYTRELQRMGVEVLYGIEIPQDIARVAASLSLVLLSRPQVAGRWLEMMREYAPRAAVVYDTVDLHWLREARRALAGTGAEVDLSALPAKAAAMRELELAMIRATDATLVVTEEERRQVLDDVPAATVHVVPNVHEISRHVSPVAGRSGVLFVGGFEHTPNAEAALALVHEVMPRVWATRPDVKVRIVGPGPPPEVQGLAGPRVEVMGWVADLDAVIESARALVAPLRYGAGMKGKVTQALAAGLPVITTPVGAEGLDPRDGEQMLVGQTAQELAERVLRLLGDDDLWSRLSREGQSLASERCSFPLLAERLADVLAAAPLWLTPAAPATTPAR